MTALRHGICNQFALSPGTRLQQTQTPEREIVTIEQAELPFALGLAWDLKHQCLLNHNILDWPSASHTGTCKHS